MALAPGGTVGRYAVISVLGHGGFGITYRARDVQLGREVAIKEYLPTAIAARNSGEIVRPRSTKVAGDFISGRERFVKDRTGRAQRCHDRIEQSRLSDRLGEVSSHAEFAAPGGGPTLGSMWRDPR